MKHVKNFLPNIKNVSFDEKKWKLNLMQQWNSIMGALVSKVSIRKIYADSITLNVSDSSWMHELYLLSGLIREKINAALDKPRIETVRFYYAAHQTKSKRNSHVIPNVIEEPAQEVTLSSKHAKALEKITDPELSKALTRLLKKCHQ